MTLGAIVGINGLTLLASATTFWTGAGAVEEIVEINGACTGAAGAGSTTCAVPKACGTSINSPSSNFIGSIVSSSKACCCSSEIASALIGASTATFFFFSSSTL